MAVEIGALRALLSLDTAAFETGVKRATAGMGKIEAKLHNVGKRFDAIGKDLTKKVSLPMVAMAGVAVRSSLQVVDSQAKLAQSLGTTVESMQVLGRAAERAGVNVSGLEQLSKDLTRRLSQAAEGGGPAADALDRLGLSASDLISMPLDQRIATINKAIADFVPAAEQAAVAGKLFGEEGSIAAMRLDPETIRTAANEITRFGVAVTEVDADKIEEANDAISALGLVSRGISNQLTVALAPTLQAIAEKIANVGAWFAQLSPEAKQFAAVAATVATALGPAAIAIGMVATGLAAIASPIGLVVAGVAAAAAVGAYFAERWGVVDAVISGVQEVWNRFSEGISGYIAPALESLKSAWENIKGAFGNLVEAFGSLFALFRGSDVTVSMSGLEQLNNVIGQMTGIAFRNIAAGLELFARGLETVTGMFAAAVQGDWTDVLNELKEFGGWFADTSVAESVSQFGATVAAAFSDMAAGILSSFGEAASAIASFVSDLDTQMSDAVAIVRDLAVDMVAAVGQMATDLYTAALDIGNQIVNGVIAGLEAKWGEVRAKARELANSLPEWVRNALGIRSPSRVFAEIGGFVVDGLVVGIDDKSQDAIDRAAKLGEDIAKATRDAAEPILRTVADGLATGNLGGIVSGLRSQASSAFSTSLQSIFAGTQTFGGMIRGAVDGVTTAMTGAGTLMGKLGAAVSAAMPVVGAVLAGVEIVKGLVGETTKLTNAIEGTFDMTGLIAGGEYDIKRTDSWLGSKTEKNFEEWAGSWAEDIGRHGDQVMRDVSASMVEAITALGLEVQEGVTHSFDFRFEEGTLPEGELYRVIEAEARKAGDAMLRASLEAAGLAREGETGAQTLNALNASLALTNNAFDRMGKGLLDIHAVSAGAARELIEAAGGFEAFASKSDFVIANLMTTGQQEMRALEMATETLTSVFGDLRFAIPETHAEFMALLDAQDIMTAQGRETYAALIDVADEFVTLKGTANEAKLALANMGASITGITASARRAIEDDIAAGQSVLRNRAAAADEAVQVAQDALAAAEQALRDARTEGDAWRQAQYDAVQDASRIAAEAARVAEGALRDAERALTDAFRAEQDRVRSLYEDQIDAAREASVALVDGYEAQIAAIEAEARARRDRIEAEADLVSDRVTMYRAIRDALVRAYDDRRVLGRDGERMQLAEASKFLADAVAAGGTTDQRGLERALAVVADPSEDLYASFEEYQQDFNVNTNRIKALGDLAEDSLTVEERTLAALEDQIAAIESASGAEVARLQELIDQQGPLLNDQVQRLTEMRDHDIKALEDQMNGLLGIETAVGTVGEAVDALAKAQADAAAASTAAAEAARVASEASVEAYGLLAAEIAAMNDVQDAQDAVDDANKAADDANDAVNPNTDGTSQDFTPGGASDQLDQLFRDILGRGIDSAGLQFYGDALANGMSLDDIENDLRRSDEAMLHRAKEGIGLEGQINRAYNRILGRNVDLAGLKFYAGLMEDGFTVDQLFDDLRKNKDSDTGIPAFARGTNFAPGGLALVGEEGPELVDLPRGAKVRTASATASALSTGDIVAAQTETNHLLRVVSASIGNMGRSFGAGFDPFGMYEQSQNVMAYLLELLGGSLEGVLPALQDVEDTLSRHARDVAFAFDRAFTLDENEAAVAAERHEAMRASLDGIQTTLSELGVRLFELASSAIEAANAANAAAAASASAAEEYAVMRAEVQKEREAYLAAMSGPDMSGATAAAELTNQQLLEQGAETNAYLSDMQRSLQRQADLKKIEMNASLEAPA